MSASPRHVQKLWLRYRRQTPVRRWLLVEAVILLLLAKLLLWLVPFRHLAPHLGNPIRVADAPSPDADKAVSYSDTRRAADIAWAVSRAVRHLPVTLLCLPQAVAARLMLQRRHVPSVLHFGVAMELDQPMRAHAWLDVAHVPITGHPAIGFVEIMRFV